MIDYQYIRHYDYSGMRTAPLCIDGHTKGTVVFAKLTIFSWSDHKQASLLQQQIVGQGR